MNIFIHDAAEDKGLRWVLETEVRRWIGEGSSVIGQWPEKVAEKWQQEMESNRQLLEGKVKCS